MKIALIGYGKMGKAIEQVAIRRGHTIVLKVSSSNRKDTTPEKLSECDIAIEFTNPAGAPSNIRSCIDAGIGVVSGSTGWLDHWDEIKRYVDEKNGSLVYASNFSIGVNIFFEVNKKLASMMAAHPEYDVQIEETHHTQKKDAPSGTAITIAEQVISELPHKNSWINNSEPSPGEVTITSKRIDPAPGTHLVKYSSPIDDIEITHTAHNREGFATGAVIAAEFLLGKKGIYSMKEVLGF